MRITQTEVPEPEVANTISSEETKVRALADVLTTGQTTLQETNANLARRLSMSERHVARGLRGIAESVMATQHSALKSFLKYVSLLAGGGHLKRKLFVHHIRHDETQRVVVGRFPDGEAQEQRGKIHIIQQEWIAVTEASSISSPGEIDTMIFKGSFSPMIKLSENATAESIARVLELSDPIPGGADGADGFAAKLKIFESDECSANLKAQSILQSTSRDGGDDAGPWVQLATVCAAHKLHQVALKTWQHFASLHTGLVKTLKMLRTPGVWPKFVEAVVEVALDVDILAGPVVLDNAALAHRRAVMQFN